MSDPMLQWVIPEKFERYAREIVRQLKNLPCLRWSNRCNNAWEELKWEEDILPLAHYDHIRTIARALVASLPNDERDVLAFGVDELRLFAMSPQPFPSRTVDRIYERVVELGWQEKDALDPEARDGRRRKQRRALLLEAAAEHLCQKDNFGAKPERRILETRMHRLERGLDKITDEKINVWAGHITSYDLSGAKAAQLFIEQGMFIGLIDAPWLLDGISELILAVGERSLDEDERSKLTVIDKWIEELPDKPPDGSAVISISKRDDGETCGGYRYYDLRIKPQSVEISSGGSTWTQESGSDSVSGPRIWATVIGDRGSEGDSDQLLRDMSAAATDPSFEIGVGEEE